MIHKTNNNFKPKLLINALLCIVLFCVSFSFAFAGEGILDSVIASYSFNNTNVDQTGNSTISLNGNTYVDSDAGGKALYFDGNDYGVFSGLSGSGGVYTFTFWAKPEAISNSNGDYLFDASAGRIVISLDATSGLGGEIGINPGNGWVDFDTTVENDVEKFYVMHIDGTRNHAEIFINGTSIGNGTLPAPIPNTNIGGTIHLGKQYSSSLNYYKGSLSQFTIWERELTDAEITFLYNDGYKIEYPFTAPPVVSQSQEINATLQDATTNATLQDFTLTAYNETYNYTLSNNSVGNYAYLTLPVNMTYDLTVNKTAYDDTYLLNQNITETNAYNFSISATVPETNETATPTYPTFDGFEVGTCNFNQVDALLFFGFLIIAFMSLGYFQKSQGGFFYFLALVIFMFTGLWFWGCNPYISSILFGIGVLMFIAFGWLFWKKPNSNFM